MLTMPQSTSSLLNKSSGGTTSVAIGAVSTGGLLFCKVGSAAMPTIVGSSRVGFACKRNLYLLLK